MSDLKDIYALCPFYRRAEKQMIFCEGVEDNSTIHIAFASAKRKEAYKKQYCDSGYRDCLVSQMLERKYDEQVQKH